MVDTAKLEKQRVRGAQAEQILESPVFNEAFAKIETAILDGWKNSEGQDTKVRENCHYLWCAAQMFKEELKQIIGTGRGASTQLIQLEQDKAA